MGDIALICLGIAVIGLFLSRRRLAGQRSGPVLLSLQCPITVSEVKAHSDGSIGAAMHGTNGGVFEFSLDGRQDSASAGHVYIGALHPASADAERLAPGCAYERELVRVLRAAADSEFGRIVAEPGFVDRPAHTYRCHHCEHMVAVPDIWNSDFLVCPNCGVKHPEADVRALAQPMNAVRSGEEAWVKAAGHLSAVLKALRSGASVGEAPN